MQDALLLRPRQLKVEASVAGRGTVLALAMAIAVTTTRWCFFLAVAIRLLVPRCRLEDGGHTVAAQHSLCVGRLAFHAHYPASVRVSTLRIAAAVLASCALRAAMLGDHR